MERKPLYVFYAATDGAGTHIIRGLFLRLKNEGLKIFTNHSMFLELTARYLYPSDGSSDKKAQTISEMNNILAGMGLDVLPENPTQLDLFTSMDAQISESDVTLDFSRVLCLTTETRSYDDIANIRKFILAYCKWENRAVDIRFIVQQRDPLDHIASLHERFGTKFFWAEIKDVVLNSHHLLKLLRADLNENGLKELYINLTLSDIIDDFHTSLDSMENLLQLPFYRDMYITRVSLNKWPVSVFALKLLGDHQIREMAKDLGIDYPQPGSFGLKFFTWKSRALRQYYELKIIIDTLLGSIEDTNPINTKHERRLSVIHKVLLKMFPSWRKHRQEFHEKMKKGNTKN
ncbi:MAG: hypothetical protein V7776_15755 [Halopseudomonas aestusnigri]